VDNVRIGMRVRVAETLGDTRGLLAPQAVLQRRKAGVTGEVLAPVGGHGGDVWWVRHDGAPRLAGTNEVDPTHVAPYVIDELTAETPRLTLAEWNEVRRRRVATGRVVLVCDACREPLEISQLGGAPMLLLSNPPKQEVRCPRCHRVDYMLA